MLGPGHTRALGSDVMWSPSNLRVKAVVAPTLTLGLTWPQRWTLPMCIPSCVLCHMSAIMCPCVRLVSKQHGQCHTCDCCQVVREAASKHVDSVGHYGAGQMELLWLVDLMTSMYWCVWK